MPSGRILTHKLDDIHDQLKVLYGLGNETIVESRRLHLDYTDLAGKTMDFTIASIQEKCTLLHSQCYVSTVFSNGSFYARMNVGLGTYEAEDAPNDLPDNVYNKLVFDNLELSVAGENDAQGDISGTGTNKLLNKFNNTIVAQITALGGWTTSNDLNVARYQVGGCGTQSAGLSFGGCTTVAVDDTEEYDGTSWTVSNDLNTIRRELRGVGTQTAGLSFGGFVSVYMADTEEYDGTSWAASNDLNTARNGAGGGGTQTSGLCFGGGGGESSTEEYDGTSWTAVNDLNTARSNVGGCGSQSAGLSFGGYSSGRLATTEEYDGTSWTPANDLNIARDGMGSAGIQTAGLSFGGYHTAAVDVTEEYDGVSWISTNTLNSANVQPGGCGTQSSGLCFGGSTGSYVATTQEYDAFYLQDLIQGELDLYITYSYV